MIEIAINQTDKGDYIFVGYVDSKSFKEYGNALKPHLQVLVKQPLILFIQKMEHTIMIGVANFCQ